MDAKAQPAAEAAARGESKARLLIDARGAARGAVDPGHELLGLTLLRRTALAAQRAGVGPIFVVADADDMIRFRAMLQGIPEIGVGETIAEPGGAGSRTICIPASVLGEQAWLENAAQAPVGDGRCRAWGGRVVICRGPVSLREIASAHARAETPQGGPDAGREPLQIRDLPDLDAARARLLRSLVRETDGFMAKHVERPLSIAVSRRLAATSITPNQMTVISVIVGLGGAPFFLSPAPLWQTVGALLFLAHSILDGCDGELARLKFLESRWGGVLDFWGDNIVHAAIFGCMAVGWSLAARESWPLALGAAAVLGTLGSAAFIYWRVMRPTLGPGPLYTSVARSTPGPLARLLNTLSRRDFVYVVLFLSLFGKAAWIAALAAVGTPAFFLMLLVVAASERAAARP